MDLFYNLERVYYFELSSVAFARIFIRACELSESRGRDTMLFSSDCATPLSVTGSIYFGAP